MITTINKCRSCGADVNFQQAVVRLPVIYPSIFTPKPEPPPLWPKVPLDLIECPRCSLVQLLHSFSPDEMYHHYWYKSSLNPSMVAALNDVVTRGIEIAGLRDGDTVLDIGCNDGTMLGLYEKSSVRVTRIGVDPSKNLAEEAKRNCDLFINDYFSVNQTQHRCRLITAIAMFYDLPDATQFMAAIDSWLSDDGVFVIQMTDLNAMIVENAFDNIVHEHLEYWSLKALTHLMERAEMTVFRVETNDVNGGSLRAYCCRKGMREVDDSVSSYEFGEHSVLERGWDNFNCRMIRTISTVKSALMIARDCGMKVWGVGASTKGNTLLQLLGDGANAIEGIGEVSKDKFGTYTIGTGIPIQSEEEMFERNPNYYLILPWHFAKGIRKKLGYSGTIIPMPEPRMNDTILW